MMDSSEIHSWTEKAYTTTPMEAHTTTALFNQISNTEKDSFSASKKRTKASGKTANVQAMDAMITKLLKKLTLEISYAAADMDEEDSFSQMEAYTQANSKTIGQKEKATFSTPTKTNMSATSTKAKNREEGRTTSVRAQSSRAVGKQIQRYRGN